VRLLVPSLEFVLADPFLKLSFDALLKLQEVVYCIEIVAAPAYG
jgi:hypothetical protein